MKQRKKSSVRVKRLFGVTSDKFAYRVYFDSANFLYRKHNGKWLTTRIEAVAKSIMYRDDTTVRRIYDKRRQLYGLWLQDDIDLALVMLHSGNLIYRIYGTQA